MSQTTKKKHTIRNISLIAAAAIAALGVSYVVYAEQYTQKFIDGTYINSINVSNLSVEQVEALIQERVEDYKIELKFDGDQKETLAGSDFDLKYTSDQAVEALLAEQNKYLWIHGKLLGGTAEYTVSEAYQYDEAKLKQVLNQLPEMIDSNMTAPVNAYMQLGDDSRFTIVPEEDGNTLKQDEVFNAVNEAVEAGKTSLDITELDGVYETAEIRSDDENLNTQVNDLNGFLSTAVTYQLHDGSTNTVDGNITKTWLATSADDPNYYYIDVNLLKTYCGQYIAQLAGLDDDVKTKTTFHSTNHGDLELDGKQYGYKIDQPAEVEALYQDLLNRTSETKAPAYAINQAEGGFGDTFVEIDIENQHVYVHQNGAVVFDSACVTGTATVADRATPKGVFKIFWKTTNRDLKGRIDPATGQPSYVSHVNFWMPFNGGVGMHDSSWRGSYGGSIYQYSGSHGCVNLPYSAAQTIYGLVSVGTYVLVI